MKKVVQEMPCFKEALVKWRFGREKTTSGKTMHFRLASDLKYIQFTRFHRCFVNWTYKVF